MKEVTLAIDLVVAEKVKGGVHQHVAIPVILLLDRPRVAPWGEATE
jgi:hypothetical protein